MADNLKKKAVKGTAWSAIDNIANNGVSFLVGIILARLLSPAEYGQIAIITIFIALFNSLVDSGFSNALIRKNNVKDVDYCTVFYFNLIVSIFLFWALFFASPYISQFFNQPTIISPMRVMGIIVIINALSIVQRTRLIKNIDFKTQTKISLIASISSGCVGITLAYLGYGVWSLVFQQISRQLLNSIFLWFFNKWVPSLQFSVESFKEMFSFGWKLLVSGLIDTIWKDIYKLVIGKFYMPATLGQYERAAQFRKIFSSNLTSIIQRVSYPVLSSVNDDPVRLKRAYQKVIKTTMFVTFCAMLGLAAVARPMILTLIGEKWMQSVGFLQIICFSGMMYPLHAINLNMLQVQGRSDLFLKLEIIKKIIAVGPLLLGIFINIYWMLIGSVFTGFFAYYLNTRYSGKEIGYPASEQIKDILPSFTIAVIMALAVYPLSYINMPQLPLFIIQIITGVALVILLSKISKNQEYLELKNIVLSFINRKHGK
ncbi:MAG: lipopolysaccharide biosynthesis protein [bacterium]